MFIAEFTLVMSIRFLMLIEHRQFVRVEQVIGMREPTGNRCQDDANQKQAYPGARGGSFPTLAKLSEVLPQIDGFRVLVGVIGGQRHAATTPAGINAPVHCMSTHSTDDKFHGHLEQAFVLNAICIELITRLHIDIQRIETWMENRSQNSCSGGFYSTENVFDRISENF